jgi:hypothetical protein
MAIKRIRTFTSCKHSRGEVVVDAQQVSVRFDVRMPTAVVTTSSSTSAVPAADSRATMVTVAVAPSGTATTTTTDRLVQGIRGSPSGTREGGRSSLVLRVVVVGGDDGQRVDDVGGWLAPRA